jgi:drug/metabolite transporter (DMT)-like permease
VAVVVITWASAFAGIRAGLAAYSPQSVALLRYGTAALLLAGYALAARAPLPRWRDWPAIAVLGLVGISLYNVALNLGETRIPAGTASLIVASAPVYVAGLAAPLFHERLSALGWLGIGLSVLGVALISVDWRQGVQLSPLALLVLAAAIAQAAYTVMQKPLLGRYPPIRLTSAAIWAGALGLLWALPGLAREAAAAPLPATLAVLYLGVFPGAIGYVCWAYVLSKLPAARAGVFLYLVPAAALIIAWVWLGEQPAAQALLGGLLVVAGVVVVNRFRA